MLVPLLVVDLFVLGYVGAHSPAGHHRWVGRVATAWYFLHFLVFLPLLGWFEKAVAAAESISKPVLRGPVGPGPGGGGPLPGGALAKPMEKA